MSNMATLCRRRDWLYRVHVVTGLAAAVWFLLMALSGVLMNHQESLGLLDAEISDRYLPDYYRADARTGATRLNILLTDLHSGRILGSRGNLVSDLIALLLVVSLASGVGSHRIKKRVQTANLKEAVRAAAPPEGQAPLDRAATMAGGLPDDAPESLSRAHRLPSELPTIDSR